MFKVKNSILSCALLLATSSLPANTDGCFWYNDTAIKKEIKAIKERLEAIEAQQKDNAEIVALHSEIEVLKNQIHSFQSELNRKLEDQQQQLTDSKDVEDILIKYSSNPDGLSALHYAIKVGDVNVVNLLLARGADINSIDIDAGAYYSFTTLTRAARYNQLEITHILLTHGADVYLAGREDFPSALSYAAEFGSGDLVTLLIENGAKLDRMFTHPLYKLKDDQRNDERTPLHKACTAGNYEAVVVLVNSGANINIFSEHNDHRETPLDCAAQLRYIDNPQNLDLVKFLVEHGAKRKYGSYNDPKGPRHIRCDVINGYLKSVNR